MNNLNEYLDHYFNVNERVEYFKQKKQFSAEIEVTNNCNLSCNYCYVEAVTEKGVSQDKQFIKNLVKELKDNEIKEIGWIGGEPLIYKDIKELMEYSHQLGLINALYTNGTLITKERAKWIAQYCETGRVIIHLDSIEYENFAIAQLHPSKEKHQKILESFDNLIEAGYNPNRIILTIPLSRPCYETAKETMQFVADKGIEFINLIPLTALGRSSEYGKFITKDELRSTFELRSEILKKPWLNDLGIAEYCKQFQLTDFSISYTGNVYPYIDDFRSQGNILKGDSISDILKNKKEELALTEWVSSDSYTNKMESHCGSCEFSQYCFGNPVSREKFYVGEPDHDCWLNN